MKKNIAILSPNKDAYSETFIRAHKNLKGNIFFYYGGLLPACLEGKGRLQSGREYLKRTLNLFRRLVGKPVQDAAEAALLQSLQRNKIDVVFAEYGVTGARVLDICKKGKIPLVVMFHGFDASVTEVLEVNRGKYKEMFEYASMVFSVSNAMHHRLIEIGCPPHKLTKATYGPHERFQMIEPTFAEPRSFVAIGRFVNKKAPYYTVLAFKKVVETYPDAKLYFAGQGELWETVNNITHYLNLQNNIRLIGVIEPQEYARLLQKVCGFVQHSVTAQNGDMEGTPVAVLEASAAGLPVVATKHAGIPDVIIDGETGYLVDERDVDGMAEKIIRLIEQPETAKRLGTAGKKHISENYSMQSHLQKIEQELFQL